MLILEALKKSGVLVFDGAMGTQLHAHGLELGRCSEEYNLSHPEIIEQIHRGYAGAGAEIVQTNTFGGSQLRLDEFNLGDKTVEINAAAVRIARAAVGVGVIVAGSIGPTGAILQPYGDISVEAATEGFRLQAEGLAGVDFINVETMGSMVEARAAVAGIKQITRLPIALSFTFNETPRGYFTMMGESVAQCAELAQELDVQIAGSNCGTGFHQMVQIITEMARATKLPLLAKSNAGLPEGRAGEQHFPETPALIEEPVKQLISAGVRIIGGCCGTGPEHIAAIRRIVDRD